MSNWIGSILRSLAGGANRELFQCTLSAGVFTLMVNGDVILPSTTAGANVKLNLTGQTYTFNDDSHASSHLNGLTFGIISGTDWDEIMPFFVYLVNEDNTVGNVGMFICRSPVLETTPAAGLIHDQDAAGATAPDSENHIFGAWPDDAGKASKPCKLIGAIHMTYNGTNTDWTVDLTYGGCSERHIEIACTKMYTMVDQQLGANAITNNYMFCTNTPPVWATPANTAYFYFIDREGWCKFVYNTQGAGNCSNGSNAEIISLILPYVCYQGIGDGTCFGSINANPSGNADEMVTLVFQAGSQAVTFQSSDFNEIQANDFSDTGDDLAILGRFKAFQLISDP